MKLTIFTITTLLVTLGFSLSGQAENLDQLRQLLATKQCPACDLSGTGLVLLNLSGAQLSGANLSQANLSQANLSGADLSGTNLSGASLNGANLSGANLSGANLTGADLRESYLTNANLTGTNLATAYLQGAMGIPDSAGTTEQFYGWGLTETQKGNYEAAIESYNKALSLNREFAPAYLARGIAQYRLGNEQGATQDAEIAAQLFETQENDQGYEASKNFLKTMESIREAKKQQEGNPELDNMVRGVGSLLLQLLLRL